MSVTTEARRLILVGAGPQEFWEPFVAAVAEDLEVALVSPDYPGWQRRYVQKHRIANITNAKTLFAAVADLRGEVADAAVLSWEAESVLPVARIAHRLRMRSMSVDAVAAAVNRFRPGPPAESIAGPEEVGVEAYGVARDGRSDVLTVVRTGPTGPALVEAWRDEPWAGRLAAAVQDAHDAAGADWGLTVTRVAVAGDGARSLGLTTWLDQDVLPVLAGTPAGVRLAKTSAAVLYDPEAALAAA